MSGRAPWSLAEPAPAVGRSALVGVRVLADGGWTAPSTVVLDGGRIGEVIPGGHAPGRLPSVELAGRYLVPGLIDAHAHLSILDGSAHRPDPPHGAEPLYPALAGHLVAAALRRAVRAGVTTVRDVGAYGDVVLEARQAMRYGAFAGPRVLACGRIVAATSPGGRFFEGMYAEADGPDAVRAAVRAQHRRGADFVKIMTTGARSVELEDPHPAQVVRAEVEAFVEEAHRLGLRTAAHCEGMPGTELAIECGVDTIEHGMFLHARPDLLDAMAARGQVLVPTLNFLHKVAEDGDWTPELIEQGKANLDAAHRTLQAALAAGVTVAMGADGPDVDRAAVELLRLVEHGMSPAAALAAATSGSAVALGLDGELGAVAPGLRADLVVLDADVLAEPAALLDPDRIRLVLRGGHLVAGADLEADPVRR